MAELLFKEEVHAIVGAAMAVYNELGSWFLEAVYQEALEIELRDRGIPFESQRELRIIYKGRPLKKTYNYLKATGLEVGPLFNFGNHDKLEWERWVRSQKFAQISGDSRKTNA